MDSTRDVNWNRRLWDVISNLYWAPRYVGLASIPKDRYPPDFDEKPFLGAGYRLYQRKFKSDHFLQHLGTQEACCSLVRLIKCKLLGRIMPSYPALVSGDFSHSALPIADEQFSANSRDQFRASGSIP